MRLALAIAACGFAAGCAKAPDRAPVMATWVVGRGIPAFDPQGPPDPVRWAIERLLSRGLVEMDSTGRVVPAAAESIETAPDGLTYTFHLRPDLTFSDGSPCRSDAFRSAIEAGVNRLDHGTFGWLLAAIAGMDKVRAGRPLPALGVTTPDPNTLVLRLSRADPLLLEKLAVPGAAVPWRAGTQEGWRDGIGDYAIATQAPGGLTLGRRVPGFGPDTLRIRFVSQSARVRSLLRSGIPDLVWPLPPDLLDQTLPPGYRSHSEAARPARHLLLVLRADLPPTSKAAARHVFANGVKQGELIAALGPSASDLGAWLPGAPPFDFPRHDPEAVRDWLERGDLGRSVHVVMAYSSDGLGARVARTLQAEWARLGLDVELRPLRASEATREGLKHGGAQLLLVESRSLLETPGARLATLIQPLRGPALGAFRTGWNTREFDPWIHASVDPATLDVAAAQQRLAEEHVILPIAGLPWSWVQREGLAIGVDPGYGPRAATVVPDPNAARAGGGE